MRKELQVVVVGSENTQLEELEAFRRALRTLGAEVSVFRTDQRFVIEDQFDALTAAMRGATHLLLALGEADSFESAILFEAKRAEVRRTAFICPANNKVLQERHSRRIEDRLVDLVVVRSPQEHSRVRERWAFLHTLVAGNLTKSAPDIARALVGKPTDKQLATAAE